MKVGQNDCLNEILAKFKTWSCGVKTKSLGQILEKPCEHSSSYIYGLIIMKVGQNDRLNEILFKFKTCPSGVEN